MCASLCINVIVISSGITCCYNVKKKWKIIEAVNPQESCKHWVLMWKSCAQSELVKEWRSPPFCRNFQSGTRSLHAQRYHCCSRLCTNQSRVCTEHAVKQQKIARTHIITEKALAARAVLPLLQLLHIVHQLAHCAYQGKGAHGYKHTHINATQKRRCACYYCYTLKWALINAQMCALFQSTKSTPCTIGAQTPPLPCYLHLLPQALLASICAQFTMCSCAQSFETMYICIFLTRCSCP